MLSSKSWVVVQSYFGGTNGDTLELLSLDSNVQRNAPGNPFRHFTPTLVLSRRMSMSLIGISLFAPFSFIGPLLRFIASENATVTIVVPMMSPLPVGWPLNPGNQERVS